MGIYSQNDKGKTDDLGRVILSTYLPEQIEGMPDAAMNSLKNKLSQIASVNGMGGSSFNSRFIITANVSVLSKDITPTAPPMHAYTLEVTFYIGDGIDGIKFSSYSINLKGVGENETKAYISALKNLKTNDSQYQTFIDKGFNHLRAYRKDDNEVFFGVRLVDVDATFVSLNCGFKDLNTNQFLTNEAFNFDFTTTLPLVVDRGYIRK